MLNNAKVIDLKLQGEDGKDLPKVSNGEIWRGRVSFETTSGQKLSGDVLVLGLASRPGYRGITFKF